jgi:hypothetical protein
VEFGVDAQSTSIHWIWHLEVWPWSDQDIESMTVEMVRVYKVWHWDTSMTVRGGQVNRVLLYDNQGVQSMTVGVANISSIALGWLVYTKYDFKGSQGIQIMILGCPRNTKYDFRNYQDVLSLTLWWQKYAEYDIRGPKMYIVWRWDDQCIRSITLEAPKVYRVWLWNVQVLYSKLDFGCA